MISSRSCTKTSAYINGSTRYYCGTHNHDMDHQQYTCALGQLEAGICAQVGSFIHSHEQRIREIEQSFNDKLKTFAANLEKLHERDPTGT